MIVVEDIIGEVIKKAFKETSIKPFYHYGTIREIVGTLNQLNNAGMKKYPIIALIEPFQSDITNEGLTASLRLLFATFTERTLKAPERMEENYKKILFPMYKAFMPEFKRVSRSSNVNHTLINHFEMGRESLTGYEGTILNDHVDVLEIKDLNTYFREKDICKLKT